MKKAALSKDHRQCVCVCVCVFSHVSYLFFFRLVQEPIHIWTDPEFEGASEIDTAIDIYE